MANNKYNLTESLISYGNSDYYPFHMPGHKRTPLAFPNPWSIDITEIDGFDDLHHPDGILLGLQKQAATLFGAKESHLLINGSTCGLLSAVSGCVKRGGTLLMSRNCHKSAYNGIYLRQLIPTYLMPDITEFGIMGSIPPEDVEAALYKDSRIEAVLIVSPTYDGIVSDIKKIAEVTHRYKIPLIVDEAHGAHLSFCKHFPTSALTCGADVVIQSLHKTLPSFTQTALLHINGDMANSNAIRHFLSIYQSSSPSYLLMASMEQCMHLLNSKGPALFSSFMEKLDTFYKKCQKLNYIHVFSKKYHAPETCFSHDNSKILISGRKAGLSGQELYELLLHKYHLQLEMAQGHYALALSGIMDRQEGFDRLFRALWEIDQATALDKRGEKTDTISGMMRTPGTSFINGHNFYRIPHQHMKISQALEQPAQTMPLEQSLGKTSQEFLYLYPPGIPLIVPGEVIDSTLLHSLTVLKNLGLKPEGLSDKTNTRINVVNS